MLLLAPMALLPPLLEEAMMAAPMVLLRFELMQAMVAAPMALLAPLLELAQLQELAPLTQAQLQVKGASPGGSRDCGLNCCRHW